MYTIIMNDDKSLTTSKRTTLYQHEKLADQLQFYIPQKCGLVDLSECIAVLKYIDQGNIPHSEQLAKDSELYNDHIRFVLPVDSKLNYFSGNVVVRIVFMRINLNEGTCEQIMRTGSLTITIEPSDIQDVSSDYVEKIALLNAQVEELKKNQVNDLTRTDDLVQLVANGEPIGKGVTFDGCSCSEGGVPSVDFNPTDPDFEQPESGTVDENYGVVEF